MIGDVIKLIVVWVFTFVGITIVIRGIIKSNPHKADPKNLILTLFLLIMSISTTIDFMQTY
jgi:hypothetical protein